MNDKRQLLPGLLQPIGVLILVALFSLSCGALQPEPSSAPGLSVTMTPAPIPTPAKTPFPGAFVGGRVYLMDRDQPVQTTVTLYRAADYSMADSTETDEAGYYSFIVEEQDTYIIFVSVGDVADDCNLRTESGWREARVIDPTLGVSDELSEFISNAFTTSLGDEITMDCEQYCD
jgi:hypothetical protein